MLEFIKGGKVSNQNILTKQVTPVSAAGFSTPKSATVATAIDGTTNKSILKQLGIDLNTVLTPKGKRKKKAGLRGGDGEELAVLLGE